MAKVLIRVSVDNLEMLDAALAFVEDTSGLRELSAKRLIFVLESLSHTSRRSIESLGAQVSLV